MNIDLINKLNIKNTKWLLSSNPFEQSRIELIEDFNENETLTLSFQTKKVFFDQNIINEIESFTNKLKSSNHVKEILTPINAAYLIKEGDVLHNVSLKYAIKNDIIKASAIPELLKNSFYQNILYDHDWQNFNIVIEPEFNDNKAKSRANLIQLIDIIIEDYPQLNHNYFITGKTFLYHQLDTKNKTNIYRIGLLAIILTLCFVGFIYRDFSRFFITALNCLIATSISLIFFKYLNINFSLLSLCLPVIVIIVTISDSIFVFNKYNFINHEDNLAKYKLLVRSIWKPCLITSLTTSFSFLSYGFSEIKPLHDLFLISPIAIFINYLWVVFITPALLIFLNSTIIDTGKSFRQWLRIINNLIRNIKFNAVRNFLIFLFLLSPSIYFLKFETNFLHIFFFKSEQIVKNVNQFDDLFIGSSDYSLVFNNSNNYDFKKVKFIDNLDVISISLTNNKYVNSTRSYQNIALNTLDKLSDGQESFTDDFEIEQILLFLEFSRNEDSKDVLSEYMTFDYTKTRLKLFTDNLNSSEITNSVNYINDIFAEHNLEQVKLSGTNAYFHGISNNLMKTQIYSLAFIFLMLFLSVCLFYNVKIASIAVFVNVIPLLSLILLCVFFQINFDFSLILVTIICFGITVDCAIHLLHEYSLDTKLDDVINSSGLAITLISLFFIICFFAFLFSNLLIFIKFGLLSITTIVISYIANIYLIPIFLKKY
ncbi:MMPL family transporter [Rickettsiales bacterium]|nr:MMPL family transporter [Rickettsiales bacterium]